MEGKMWCAFFPCCAAEVTRGDWSVQTAKLRCADWLIAAMAGDLNTREAADIQEGRRNTYS